VAKPKTPLLTADCVVFDRDGRLLLIRRKNPPFKGRHALPGGFVDVGVEGKIIRLIGVYSGPKRDPRAHTVSAAFLIRPRSTKVQGGDDAQSAAFVADWRGLKLAFDHNAIVSDASLLRRD
jgi:8-oxo-dGTP diphosphatase